MADEGGTSGTEEGTGGESTDAGQM
jgi:hypothetical protein